MLNLTGRLSEIPDGKPNEKLNGRVSCCWFSSSFSSVESSQSLSTREKGRAPPKRKWAAGLKGEGSN